MRDWAETHKTLVVLGVPSEDELRRWRDRLAAAAVSHAVFVEPDMGDQATALAALATGPARRLFAPLRLLDPSACA